MAGRLPVWMARSGTSRGLFVRREALRLAAGVAASKTWDALHPREIAALAAALGAGPGGPLEGVGGGGAVSCKAYAVAADGAGGVACWFVQARVGGAGADLAHGDCGNMLAGIGPFALESGLLPPPSPGATSAMVPVRSGSSGQRFDVSVRLRPDGAVEYDGAVVIAGVPGAASPVGVHSVAPGGTATGALWPAGGGAKCLELEGVRVTCVDATRALVVVDAAEVGMDCAATPAALDGDHGLMDRLERVRVAAGRAMGLGDCSGEVAPKICAVAPGPDAGSLSVRYFVAPFRRDTHPTVAMTAAQALAVAALTPGTVPHSLVGAPPPATPLDGGAFRREMRLCHASGIVAITVDTQGRDLAADGANLLRTGYIRTVRPILRGELLLDLGNL